MTTTDTRNAEQLELAEAVREVTAFRSWKEMYEAISFDGYCPTLRIWYPRPMGVEQGKANHAVRVIRREMERRGLPYFDGSKVIGGK